MRPGWSRAAERDTMASGKRRGGGAGGNGLQEAAKLTCRKMVVKSDRGRLSPHTLRTGGICRWATARSSKGAVHPAHAGPSPELAAAHRAMARIALLGQTPPTGRTLVLVAELQPPRERWWLHGLLFALTLLTTTIAGATFAGIPADVAPAIVPAHARRPVVLASALRNPGGARIRPLSDGAAISRERQPALLSPVSAAARTSRHHGRVHPPPLPAVRSAHALRHWRRGPVRRNRRRHPGTARSDSRRAGRRCCRVPLAHQFIVVEDWHLLLGDSLLLSLCRAIVGAHGTIALIPLAIAGMDGAVHHLPQPASARAARWRAHHLCAVRRAQAWVARIFWLLLIPLGVLWHGMVALGRARA